MSWKKNQFIIKELEESVEEAEDKIASFENELIALLRKILLVMTETWNFQSRSFVI